MDDVPMTPLDVLLGKDLSFIDCGLSTLDNIEVEEDVVSLNFHSNHIPRITNLHKYRFLRHLDVSSNQILSIENLDLLTHLKTLNLSNNQIRSIPNLKSLISLKRLDVSYNFITDPSGIVSLEELQVLLIQGNQLKNAEQFISIISTLKKITHLVTSEGSASNPMCTHNPDYFNDKVWKSVPHLISLDYMDKFGIAVDINDAIPPGVEEFVEFLTSDNYFSSEESAARKIVDKSTPNILAGVKDFSSKPVHVSSSSTTSTSAAINQERLENLERQLSLLLRNQVQNGVKSQNFKSVTSDSQSNSESIPMMTSQASKSGVAVRKTHRAVNASKKSNTDNQTVSSLIKEVETEKAKRWKVEETVSSLKTNLVNLKNQINEQKMLEEASANTISDLKSALTEEQSKNKSYHSNLRTFNQNLENKDKMLSDLKKEKETLAKELQLRNTKIVELENSVLTSNARDTKRDQESVQQMKVLAKEYEKLQDYTKSQINKIKNLENELEERTTELKKKFYLESPEVQKRVEEKTKHMEKEHENEKDLLRQKISEWTKDYKELEDEFRMALYSEEARYNELVSNLLEAEKNLKDLGNSYDNLKQKYDKSSKLVQELTSVVKEQKGRVMELQSVKQDLQQDVRTRSKNYEEQIEKLREKIKEFEVLKLDKTKLAAHIQAQDSIIEGLRKERRLWEDELAKQGTSLAADRGRLEVRIENLEKELIAERKSHESEKDSLKIKTKVIEDQTDTIKKLKEAILERDNTIIKTREDSLKDLKALESQLSEETKLRQDLQEELSLSTERKHALREDIASVTGELEEKTSAYEDLMKKWKQKSALIGQLEVQVKEMKGNWDRKEREIISERDKAVAAASSAVDKLKETEERLQREIQETREKFEGERLELVNSCDSRIEEIENEMRQMLKEHESYKRSMESKFNKLHSAISDFQSPGTL